MWLELCLSVNTLDILEQIAEPWVRGQWGYLLFYNMHIHWLYAGQNKETVGKSWNFRLKAACSGLNSANPHKGDQGHHWKEDLNSPIYGSIDVLSFFFFFFINMICFAILRAHLGIYGEGVLVGSRVGCLFCRNIDACFASALFDCVPMNHISRITGLQQSSYIISLCKYRDKWFIHWWSNNSFKKGVNMPTFPFLSTRPSWPLVSTTKKNQHINELSAGSGDEAMLLCQPKRNGYQPKIYVASFLACLSPPRTNSCSLNLSGRSWTVHTLCFRRIQKKCSLCM